MSQPWSREFNLEVMKSLKLKMVLGVLPCRWLMVGSIFSRKDAERLVDDQIDIAGYRFVKSLISSAFEGKPVVENTYIYVKSYAHVKETLGEEVDYFSVPVKLGVSLSLSVRILNRFLMRFDIA
jgi:hypothetical protein